MLHRAQDKRRLHNKIQEHLKNSPTLRPFPEAVTRLVVACREPETKTKEIEEIIACDPSMSVNILRLANSPLFCVSRDVTSIGHAVALLGRRKVKSVGMSAAASSMFASGDSAATQRQKLWTHSLGCASVASSLAHHVAGIDSADAFLAGVFHDVGKLLFFDVIPEEYKDLASSHQGDSLIREEEFVLGTTHQEIGLRSANLWGLSNDILAAIGWHHQPDEAPFESSFASVIAVANQLAKEWELGSSGPLWTHPDTELFKNFDLTDELLEIIKAESFEAYEQMNTM